MNSGSSSQAFLLARVGVLPRLLIMCGVLLMLLLLAMIYAASTGPTSIPAGMWPMRCCNTSGWIAAWISIPPPTGS